MKRWEKEGFCSACLDGDYPIQIPTPQELGNTFMKTQGKGNKPCGPKGLTYSQAGVDIEKGNEAVELMKPFVKSTFVLKLLQIWGFGDYLP